MIHVRLFCGAGMSTSLLARKMSDYAASKGIDAMVDARAVSAIKQSTKEQLQEIDCALLGPQVAFEKAQFEPIFKDAGVPFAAYIAQRGNWCIKGEKRENAIRGKYEKSVDFSLECLSSSEEPGEDSDLRLLRKATACKPDFVEDIHNNERIQKIYQAAEQSPKLQRYFGTCIELTKGGYEYSDAEVARRLGCTRANVGLYKKALNRLARENGLLDDSYPPAA